ncbi:MAG: RAMP superfamily CRISPR-associated protein [Salinibacter sp.]
MDRTRESEEPVARWSARQSRKIVSWIVVEGDLVLTEPAHFGNGEVGDFVDMPLLIDEQSAPRSRPLLTGDSIAGALRTYLRSRAFGHRAELPDPDDDRAVHAENSGPAVLLLGGFPGDDEGNQSPLVVRDSLGDRPTSPDDEYQPGIELREGVRIGEESRTARHEGLFDLEAWSRGTVFPLRFELAITEGEESPDPELLRQALYAGLSGFANGEIALGARKRRGFGKAEVERWRARRYDLTDPDDLLDWIEHGDDSLDESRETGDLREALGVTEPLEDRREWFRVTATFGLDSSLLIRSGAGPSVEGPDTVHLHALQPDGPPQPVLSGTSVAGALRARALKIAKTLAGDEQEARALIDAMFGPPPEEEGEPEASRVHTREKTIQNATDNLVQNRVSIDRFTGGAYPGALFNQQPVFGDEETDLTVDLKLVKPGGYPRSDRKDPEQDATLEDHEFGLLLLLLKDLWTGDLPLGGETNAGRGRLKGKKASLTWRENGREQTWRVEAAGGQLRVDGDAAKLEACVSSLNQHLNPEEP